MALLLKVVKLLFQVAVSLLIIFGIPVWFPIVMIAAISGCIGMLCGGFPDGRELVEQPLRAFLLTLAGLSLWFFGPYVFDWFINDPTSIRKELPAFYSKFLITSYWAWWLSALSLIVGFIISGGLEPGKETPQAAEQI